MDSRTTKEVQVCVHRWRGVCSESSIALGIPDLFWLVHLQLQRSMGKEGPSLKQPNSYFSALTHTLLLSLERWLTASQLFNQAFHLYFIDRCNFPPQFRELWFVFRKPLGKAGFHGTVICASDGCVNVWPQLHAASQGMGSFILARKLKHLALWKKAIKYRLKEGLSKCYSMSQHVKIL